MNLPNFLTVSRFFLSFFMVFLLFWRDGRWAWAAFAVFLAASLTDYWDGRLARQRNEVTFFGKLMDPIADKTLTLGAFGSFWALGLLPGLWVLVVAVRDTVVTWTRLFSRQAQDQAVRSSGKNKTFLQMTYICLVMAYLSVRQTSFWNDAWDPSARWLVRLGMILIVVLTLWSGLRILVKRKT